MKFLHQRKPKQKGLSFTRRRKRAEPTSADLTEDERLKRQWLESHAITKLPAGWSRYGY